MTAGWFDPWGQAAKETGLHRFQRRCRMMQKPGSSAWVPAWQVEGTEEHMQRLAIIELTRSRALMLEKVVPARAGRKGVADVAVDFEAGGPRGV